MKKCTKCAGSFELTSFYVTKGVPFSWCKKCSRDHQKQYNQKKRVYLREYRKTEHGKLTRELWLSINSEKVKSYDRKKYLKHKDKCVTRVYRRVMAMKRIVGTHTLEEWNDLKHAFGFKCYVCNVSEPFIKLTKDHITPVSKGGDNFITNIIPLCGSCNSRKGAKNEAWYMEQFHKNRLLASQFNNLNDGTK